MKKTATYGTGSYPLPPQGLHDIIRLNASQPPFNSPCFCKASKAYSEQVGVYLHDDGVKGDINRL